MSTAVQFRRGTTAQHASFTGAVGEITVDTTKDTAVVHDGALAGGYPLLKEAAIGSSVQAFDATILKEAAIGVTLQGYDADTAKTDVTQSFTRAQRGTPVALTSTSASIATDFALGNNFSHTTTENTTLANPSNVVAGQSGIITITQGATPRSMAFGSYWKFPGGAAPSLTSTASAVDILAYYVESSTRITARLVSDTK